MNEFEFLEWLYNELLDLTGDPADDLVVAIEERMIQLEADE